MKYDIPTSIRVPAIDQCLHLKAKLNTHTRLALSELLYHGALYTIIGYKRNMISLLAPETDQCLHVKLELNTCIR